MTRQDYHGPERRKFMRMDYVTPLAYKVCNPEIIAKLLEGYTADVSEVGLQCTITSKVVRGDILWLSFDRSTLLVCEEMEKQSLIYQNGIIGKVAWVDQKKADSFNVGVQFLTRAEKQDTHIYPKIHFLLREGKGLHHVEEEAGESADEENA